MSDPVVEPLHGVVQFASLVVTADPDDRPDRFARGDAEEVCVSVEGDARVFVLVGQAGEITVVREPL